jgi:hypothetical protein
MKNIIVSTVLGIVGVWFLFVAVITDFPRNLIPLVIVTGIGLRFAIRFQRGRRPQDPLVAEDMQQGEKQS